ncbi:carbohydate-binding domain-containing protein [Chitinibacter bivalviorum]|uniref:beta-N-acetylhexosaminidase n=1 Tax=Chitinibacter bivalviorum TaxID=2739434 RepID=A0A7H9BG63_9NEIS|nr:family 20 glycosylhydrolase [Chitinibacter bivalviorum]QLG86921.1 carbohydate-binding domain-containing protein [Chitinibacter bivalviorum]
MNKPAGAHLKLTWACKTNAHNGDNFLAELTLTNLSDQSLPASGWAIYFNTCRKIKPETVSGNVHVTHVNGDFWSLEPKADFGVLQSGETRTFAYEGLFWVISETDAPLGFYIVYDVGTPNAKMETIGDPVIAEFATPAQRNRKSDDAVALSTPAQTFEENQGLSLLATDAISKITPTPLSYLAGQGQFSIAKDTLIVHSADLANEAAFLQSSLLDVSGVVLQRAAITPAGAASIKLQIGAVKVNDTLAPNEAYQLDVSAAGIVITGASAAGVFNGIQSLRQLLPVEAYLNPQAKLNVAACQVIDAPRFAYRGMHLDVGRNFTSKDTILRLLECMALYKLNQFHFHLTDDEGWRVEIPSLPELTEIGSQRGYTADETDNLVPCFGSGGDVAGEAGSGFYSKADFIEILKFATARHIEVVPEIDVPGHARAAIKAMNVRYTRLMAQGREAEAKQYLLCDFNDASVYESVQLWHDNVICIAQESCYNFIETVLDDLKAMFIEAGAPFTTMHTGGDEVPHGVWEQSPVCQAFMKEQGMSSIVELQNYFLARYRDLLKKHGLVFGGWEEIALVKQEVNGAHVHGPNPEFVNANFRPYVWNNVWGWGQEDFAYQLANAGYKTVLSNVTNLYFDLAYNKDPLEPGYYWGGFIETRGAFEFVPLDIFTTATVNLMGQPLDKDNIASKVRLTPEGTKNIIGIQGQLWAENIRNRGRLEYLAMPRTIALAERAWAKDPAWTSIADAAARQTKIDADWNEFANRLGQRELARLDGFVGGYGYRIPLPGVKIVDGKLHANVSAPGLVIRFTSDGSDPTPASAAYTAPVAVSGTVKVAVFSSTNRRSRIVTV